MGDDARDLDLRFARLVSGFGPEEQRDMVWVVDTRDDADAAQYTRTKRKYFDTTWDNIIVDGYIKRIGDDSDHSSGYIADSILNLKRMFDDKWYNKHEYRLSDAVNASAIAVVHEVVIPTFAAQLRTANPEVIYCYLRRSTTTYTQFAQVVGARMNSDYFSRMVYKPAAKLSGSRSYMQGNSAARGALRAMVVFKLHLRTHAARILDDLRRVREHLERVERITAAGLYDNASVETLSRPHYERPRGLAQSIRIAPQERPRREDDAFPVGVVDGVPSFAQDLQDARDAIRQAAPVAGAAGGAGGAGAP